MSQSAVYPLKPAKESELEPGQFWSIPLSDGRFGCGVVMETDRMLGEVDFFHGVLLDWVGTDRPTAADVLAAAGYLAKKSCGVGAITTGGGRIEGRVDVERLQFGLPYELETENNGSLTVYRGSEYVRPATAEDRATLQRRSMGSIGSFRVRAESRLVTTRRLIVLWRPHPEVNHGKLRELLETVGPVEPAGRRLGPLDGEKVFYAVNPKRRQFIGESWYNGPAKEALDRGYAPFVFDYAPGSELFKRAVSAAVARWDGYVDNGVEPIMTTGEFEDRYPLDSEWAFAE